MDEQWLEALQVGDDVAVVTRLKHSPQLMNVVKIAKVQRLTKTQIVLDDHRYRRTNGTECGAGRCGSSLKALSPITRDIEEELERRKIARLLTHSVNFGDYTLESLRKIYTILNEERLNEHR